MAAGVFDQLHAVRPQPAPKAKQERRSTGRNGRALNGACLGCGLAGVTWADTVAGRRLIYQGLLHVCAGTRIPKEK